MNMDYRNNHKILINEDELNKRVEEIAREINKKYEGQTLIVVGVLKGSFMFMSDLLKKITVDTEVYFLKASSFMG